MSLRTREHTYALALCGGRAGFARPHTHAGFTLALRGGRAWPSNSLDEYTNTHGCWTYASCAHLAYDPPPVTHSTSQRVVLQKCFADAACKKAAIVSDGRLVFTCFASRRLAHGGPPARFKREGDGRAIAGARDRRAGGVGIRGVIAIGLRGLAGLAGAERGDQDVVLVVDLVLAGGVVKYRSQSTQCQCSM